MLDRAQIAIQRDARKHGVDQRAETTARRPVRRTRQLDDFHRRELQVRRLCAGDFRRLRHRLHCDRRLAACGDGLLAPRAP